MARVQARRQQPTKREMTCPSCKRGECTNCPDVLLAALGRSVGCTCTRANHSGEPNQQQIMDPETGTVHAPGLEVGNNGQISMSVDTPSFPDGHVSPYGRTDNMGYS